METQQKPVPMFFTTKSLAEHLNVSTQTVRGWAESGTLPSRRLGRKIVFLPSDLEATLAALSVAPAIPSFAKPEEAPDSAEMAENEADGVVQVVEFSDD